VGSSEQNVVLLLVAVAAVCVVVEAVLSLEHVGDKVARLHYSSAAHTHRGRLLAHCLQHTQLIGEPRLWTAGAALAERLNAAGDLAG